MSWEEPCHTQARGQAALCYPGINPELIFLKVQLCQKVGPFKGAGLALPLTSELPQGGWG